MPTTRVGDIDVFYEDTGVGDPLVLVHGGFWDHRMWMFAAPILAESFRVIAVDLRGHGQSTGDLVDDPLRVVDDLSGLVTEIGIGSAYFAGQSMGAQLLVHLVMRRPEIFRGLSIHEPAFATRLPDELRSQTISVTAETSAHFRAGKYDDAFRVFFPLIGREWADLPPPVQEILLANAPNYTGSWFADPDHELWTIDEGALSSVTVPTQLTTGDRAAPLHKAVTELLAGVIPNAEVAIIDGAGHGAMLENPQGYADALASFFNRASCARGG